MQEHAPPAPPWGQPINVSSLNKRKTKAFSLSPDAPTREALAKELGIEAIRKLTFSGQIDPVGKSDWRLSGALGATVVQACVVTLEPVTSRIDEPVDRVFLSDFDQPDVGSETEMPEDDTVEALGTSIDPGMVMAEALALALPPYPRADGATLEVAQFTEPGKTPMRDEDARPFAVLKGLTDKLNENDGEP